MSVRWKATLPKDPLPEGFSHFVLALKTDTGERVELRAKAMTPDVLVALRSLQEAVNKGKQKAAALAIKGENSHG